ncbi:OmpA family protein [Endozoicomonas elysicola]|uniref:OmpA family protein n=1 Tax=Endozoicomonas elysicola TaxID=305900 RepID=UPI00068BA335|nr:OmpA family protein [Endozoicomonas elysicola]
MNVRRFAQSAIAMAVAGIINHSAIAQEATDKGLILSIGASYNALDSYRELDNSFAQKIGAGYRLNDRFSIAGIYSQYTTDHKNGGDVDLKSYRLDTFYDLTPWNGELTPYLVAGIDELQEKPDAGEKRDDTRMNAGAGVRKALTPNLSLQGDVRVVRSLDYNQTESMFNVALNWTFGSVSQTAPKATEVNPVTRETVASIQPAISVDSDQDGIQDTVDLCPGTITGAAVDQTGCVPMEEINLLVTFDFDSDAISSSAMSMIGKMGDFMTRYPDVKIRIKGHTDNQGHEDYNQVLSTKRADAVRESLIDQYKIDGDRIESIGFGEIEPVTSNMTKEGRQQNRRVVAEVIPVK